MRSLNLSRYPIISLSNICLLREIIDLIVALIILWILYCPEFFVGENIGTNLNKALHIVLVILEIIDVICSFFGY